MNEIFVWMKGIAVFLIFSGILLQILPDEKYRKYVRFILGLILMLLLADPLLRLTRQSDALTEKIRFFTLEQKREELQEEISHAEDAYKKKLEEGYKEILNEQLEELLLEDGYQLMRAESGISMEENDFGKILFLSLTICRTDPEEEESPGEERKSTDPEENNFKDSALRNSDPESEDDFRKLKRKIQRQYDLEEEEVLINGR